MKKRINTALDVIDMKETVIQQPKQSMVDIKILASEKDIGSLVSPPLKIDVRSVKLKVKDLNEDQTLLTLPHKSRVIVVPSMGSVSKVFLSHLNTLNRLRDKVQELKQAIDI